MVQKKGKVPYVLPLRNQKTIERIKETPNYKDALDRLGRFYRKLDKNPAEEP